MTSHGADNPPPDARTVSFARVFSDLPVPDGETPHFEFEGLGRTLAELALNPVNPTPFTTVIRGGWGRGKTTLMRHTRHLLLNPPADFVAGREHRQVLAIWFNAWKYPDDDTVLAGLLGELLLAFQRGSLKERLLAFIENNKEHGFKTLLQMLAPAALQVVSGGLGVPLSQDAESGPGRFEPLARARAFHDVFRDLFTQLSHQLFVASDVAKPYRRPEDLWDEESQRKYVLAVFLDDLDRCRRQRVAEVLEAINLFLDLPGVCFYLGLDWRRLSDLLPETVAGSAEPFLEKIVQVSFELPQIADSDAEEFVRQLIADTVLADILAAPRDDDEPDDVQVIAGVLDGEQRHPRHIKRFLNDLAMGLAVLRNTERLGEGGDLVPEAAVVAWHLLSEVLSDHKWRDLRGDLANVKTFLATWEAAPSRTDEGARPEEEAGTDEEILDRQLGRLRETGLLDRHVRALKDLNDAQLLSLVHLASPQVVATASRPRPDSDLAGADLLDLRSHAWVEVPAGTFSMGSEDGDEDERPVHQVMIAEPFRLGRYPVTNAQYLHYVHAVKASPPAHWHDGEIPEGKHNHPVVNVSWQDAVAFCVWLTRSVGDKNRGECRLPTEAEWEYAAKGQQGRVYPWGDEPPTPEHANIAGNIGSTSPVDGFAKGRTPLGIYDLAGNVWEWCLDGKRVYAPRRELDPRGPEADPRVLRGGSFYLPPHVLRCAYRNASPPDYRFVIIGFRVLWSASGGQ